jgi:hypothetical protein
MIQQLWLLVQHTALLIGMLVLACSLLQVFSSILRRLPHDIATKLPSNPVHKNLSIPTKESNVSSHRRR